MLSRTGIYALRAVITLARSEDGWRSASQLANELDVPANYLSKTLNQLARVGVLASRRGPQGGFRLARPPEELSVADVVEPFDNVRRAPQCIIHARPCDPDHPCEAHSEWVAWREATLGTAELTTIANLIGSTGSSKDLVSEPPLSLGA